MSQINIRNLSNENDDGSPEIVGVSTFSATSYFVPPKGTTAERPSNCEPGSIRFNTDVGNLEYFRGEILGWSQFELVTPNLGGGTGSNTGFGTRGVRGGGGTPGSNDNIDFLTISTLGNSQDFGDLTAVGKAQSGAASRTRGLFAASDSPNSNRIDFITIATTGAALDFGDIESGSQRHANPVASQTRALFCGGYGGASPDTGNCNIIDMVTIAVKSDSKDFGDLSYKLTNGGSCASSTRGIVAGGQNPGYLNNIDHITIATLGNAVDRGGDLTVGRRTFGSASNSVKGIFFGGQSDPSGNTDNTLTNTIDQIIIASNGDATDFGDLTFSINNGKILAQHGMASATRVVMPGGNTFSSNNANTIEYVEIATTGNSIDFGTLEHKGSTGVSAFSNGHGGL